MEENLWSLRSNRQKFYNSREWRNLREYKLSIDPFCEICKKFGYDTVPASCVDHQKDIIDAPELRLDINNLTSMCGSCHSRKSFKKLLKTNNKANEKRKKQTLTIKRLWKI